MRKLMYLTIAAMVSVSVLTVRHVRADTPIIIIPVGVKIAAGAAAAGGALLAWAFSDDDDKGDVEVNIEKGSDNNTVEIDPAIFRIPQDLLGMQLPAGMSLSEVIAFSPPGPNGTIETTFKGVNRADVLAGTPSKLVRFSIKRKRTTGFHKPQNWDPDEQLVMKLDIEITDLRLATEPVPNTLGTAFFRIEIGGPEVGKIFSAQARVVQGAGFESFGDIPQSAYTADADGVRINFRESIDFSVPKGITGAVDRIELIQVITTGGTGINMTP